MKKLLFSALACVVFAFNGFASNEVVEAKEFVKYSDKRFNSNIDVQIDIQEEPEVWIGCESRVTIKNPIGDGTVSIIKRGIVWFETYIGFVKFWGFHRAHLAQYSPGTVLSEK